MTHLDAERNGDATAAPLLLASGRLGRRRAWGRQACAIAGWGNWGLGRRRPLDSPAGARAVGCGAPARDNFGVGGIGRRRFGRASAAVATPGASLRHRLLAMPGSGALLAAPSGEAAVVAPGVVVVLAGGTRRLRPRKSEVFLFFLKSA